MDREDNGTMSRFDVDFTVSNYKDVHLAKHGVLPPDQVRRLQLKGTVDTGASYLVLTPAVVKQLGLPSAGTINVRYADQRRATRPVVADAQVELLGRDGVFRAIVEPKRTKPLIGAIVLEDLDLVADYGQQALFRRDPKGMTAEIE